MAVLRQEATGSVSIKLLDVHKFGRLLPFEKEYFRKDGTRVPVLVGVARFKEPQNQGSRFRARYEQTKAISGYGLRGALD